MSECLLKFSGIQNLTSARFAAAAMADWIGFNLDQNSKHYINLLKAQDIIGWLVGPNYIAEFEHANIETIIATIQLLNINAIQVPIHQFDEKLLEINKEIFVQVELEHETFLNQVARINLIKHLPVNFILTGDYQPSFQDFLSTLALSNNLYIGFNYQPGLIKLIDNKINPKGYQIIGEPEDQPGLGDTETMNILLEEIDLIRY